MKYRYFWLVLSLLSMMNLSLAWAQQTEEPPKPYVGTKPGKTQPLMLDLSLNVGFPFSGTLAIEDIYKDNQQTDLKGAGYKAFPYMTLSGILYMGHLCLLGDVGALRQVGKAVYRNNEHKNVGGKDLEWEMVGGFFDLGLAYLFYADPWLRLKMGAGLGGYSLGFTNEEGKQFTYDGWGSVFGVIGFDFDLYRFRSGTLFTGVNIRADVYHSWIPDNLDFEASELAGRTLWMPISLYFPIGWRF